MFRGLIVLLIVAGVVAAVALLPGRPSLPAVANIAATAVAASNPTEIPFVQGGNVALDLEAGNYDIVASSDNKINVSYELTNGANARAVRITSGVNGSNARLNVVSPSNGFSAEIAVPQKSNLYVRLTAGNLNIDPIEGSKDIEARAGNLTMDVGEPALYGPVYASVSSGNLEGRPWSSNKSGLFRSFSTTGPGRYGMHVHVGAGNVVLTSNVK